jgi:holo-[acyl-carrier protein] synthase
MIQPNISGVGVDIESIERFRNTELVNDKLLLKKIFTTNELIYCSDYADPAPHLAVRFAAKEAIIKALAATGIIVNEFSKIEILNDKSSIPHAAIHVAEIDKIHINISLSHNQGNAIAFAVVTK